jgi:hypothetical protein
VIFLAHNGHIFPRVFDVLAAREGQEVTLPTLETLTGFDALQIRRVIAHARKHNPDHARRIEVTQSGRAWKFTTLRDANGDPTVEKVLEEVGMGSPHIWKHVLKALQASTGIVSKEMLAEQINNAGDVTLTPEQVTTGMYTILSRPEIARNIEVVWAGRSWRYKGKKSKATPTASTQSAESREGVSSSIKASVLRYFTGRPGDMVFLNDVVTDLGFTSRQVQSAVYSLAHSDGSLVKNDFVTVQQGQSWQYIPNRAAGNGQSSQPLERVPAYALNVKPDAAVHAQATSTTPVITAEPAKVPVVPAPLPLKTTAGGAVIAHAAAPTTPPTGRLFEEVGRTSNGEILIRETESKTIYRAIEL